ncbi:MAG TPA: hypothetical protein VGN18_15020 [Jatrophihabitans sp.]|jgi:hypothetical protein|uniref:hypothetical protein n=1 Tax=Jatrophihabitans sp. TaxID=1932789 RepID=UPI002E015354|nr:hypothetical protein [Jatrophihabitans sp.]
MRGIKKVLVAITAVGLASTVAACSSSGSSSDKKPIATVKDLSGGVSTSVALDANFVKALTSLKLAPGLVGKATMPTAGTVTFPITGGNVTVYKKGKVTPYVQGTIRHDGSGLSLKGGNTTVTLENFVIDPGNNSKLTGDVLANGKSVVKGATLFDLDGSTLQPITVSGNIATLTGTRVLVSKDAAALLDKTFNTTAVTGGLLVGVATLKVKVA